MKKYRLSLLLLILIGLMRAAALAESATLPELKLYGEAGADKILVSAGSGVENPGRYYVERGTTLTAFVKLAGGLRQFDTTKTFPAFVIRFSKTKPSGRAYRFGGSQDLGAVQLDDGDTLTFQREPKQYGEPGPDKILVIVDGGVEQPGRYYVKRGTTLADFLKLAGGLRRFEACNCLPAFVFRVSTTIPNGRSHRFGGAEDLGAVQLYEGDALSFPHVHL